MGFSSSVRGLDISTASEHLRSSSASRADINSPGPAFGRPGSTSTFLGRHILPQAGTRLPWAGLYVSWPAYLCPGRHWWGQGLLRLFPGRHVSFLAGFPALGPTYSNFGPFWPEHASSGPVLASLAGICKSGPRLGCQRRRQYRWASNPFQRAASGLCWAPAGPWPQPAAVSRPVSVPAESWTPARPPSWRGVTASGFPSMGRAAPLFLRSVRQQAEKSSPSQAGMSSCGQS
jgi:hypothetical protein